jgi:Mrp family chromosome partitioning ATPase
MQSGSAAGAMRLGDYVGLLRRQWLAVLLCLILGVGLAYAYIQFAPKEYRSQASVLVTATTTDSSNTKVSEINLDTEAQLVTSTETVAAAASALGSTPGDVADRVNVSVPPNTEILDITYIGDTAKDAQAGARAFADAYLAQRQEAGEAALKAESDGLQTRIDAVQAQLDAVLKTRATRPANSPEAARDDEQAQALNGQLANLRSSQTRVQSETVTPGTIVTDPPLPGSPSSPDPFIALAAGVLLGLAAGVGLAALRHRADDVIRSPEDLYRRTGVPVTSVLSSRLHDGEVTVLQPLSSDGRGYARLRNLVTTNLEESTRRVVLVAGVRRGGGPVAVNLAASLARAGEDVVLVCADVFGHTASALLPNASTAGLAEVLAGESSVDSVVHRLPGIPTLRILGPGVDVDRADALLQTRSPRKLVARLLESATYVVLEAPPTTDSPDAQTLANVAELAVLVVESGPTRAREVLDACAQLESMGTPVLGAVIARYGKDSDADLRSARIEDDDEDEDGTDVVETEETTENTVATPTNPPATDPVVAREAPTADTSTSDRPQGENPVGLPRPTDTQLVPPGSVGPAPR